MHIHLTKARVAVAILTVVVLLPTTAVATHIFDDVDDGRFFAAAVERAADNGITTGTSATTFDPDRGVTRGESVTFLNRYDTKIVQPAITAASPQLFTATASPVTFTTSLAFVPLEDMSVDVVVPPGGSWRALITFSAQTLCSQVPIDMVLCWIQPVINDVDIPDPGAAVFDTVNESLGGGSYSHQWTHALSPGTHTIEMQYSVNQANSTFTVFERTLSVQLFPA